MSTDLSPDREFMSRVVPWPGTTDPGFCNLHWTAPSLHDPKRIVWMGKPTRTLEEFFKLLNWVRSRSNTRDIYFCLSRQGKCATNKNNKPVAARLQEDAVALSSLWLDLDVKPPPKGYESLAEALAVCDKFVHTMSLPSPSAYVGSGGGVHVYWFLDHPHTRDEWQGAANGLKAAALAFGLRCDIGCSIDASRVLRVPGTWNFKTDPPRPVQILLR